MKYKLQYIEAVERSEEHGLVDKSQVFPMMPKPLKEVEIQKYLDVSCALLSETDLSNTRNLVENCALVHYLLGQSLNARNLPCHVTVGEFHRDGRPYFNFASIDELIQEASSPNHGDPIALHAWLTLPDGSVMDWTMLADMNVLEGNAPPLLQHCCIYMPANAFDPDFFYVPKLVGHSYLEKIGAVLPS